jgi:hypothetical protein
MSPVRNLIFILAFLSNISADAKSLALGWNLLGNNLSQPIVVSTVFASPVLFNTVWTWDVVKLKWNFYSPSMTQEQLQAFASSKGYGVLSQIEPEEGYWVNAKTSSILTLGNTCSNGADNFPTCTPPQCVSSGIDRNKFTYIWSLETLKVTIQSLACDPIRILATTATRASVGTSGIVDVLTTVSNGETASLSAALPYYLS